MCRGYVRTFDPGEVRQKQAYVTLLHQAGGSRGLELQRGGRQFTGRWEEQIFDKHVCRAGRDEGARGSPSWPLLFVVISGDSSFPGAGGEGKKLFLSLSDLIVFSSK